jgi:hypothetical protein
MGFFDWLKGRSAEPQSQTNQREADVASDPGTVLPKEILWLLDAPMFIDEHQVEAFYDATLTPRFAPTTNI